jgi:putative hemolysin
MASVTFEIAFIVVLVITNGALSMAEIAILSARKIRLQRRAKDGDLKARAALDLAGKPTDFLATVQIGITLVGVLAGAFSGATIAEQIAAWVGQSPLLAPYSEAIGVGIVVVIVTYLTLVLGELAPKRLALSNPERIASGVAGSMRLLARLNAPAIKLLTVSTDFVVRLIGVRPSQEPPITTEEIKILIEQGRQAGVFELAEEKMVSGVFRLGDRRVGTLMTPRTEIVWLDLDDTLEVNQRKIVDTVFSRFPVAQGSLDNILGMVQVKALLATSLAGQPFDVKAGLCQPLFVPENMPALKAFDLIRQSPTHTALVIDEFGGLQGLVTLTDIVQAIVGDLSGQGVVDTGIVQREDGSWLVDGMLPIDEFKDFFDLDDLPEEERADYQTLGGFAMTCLGRIPVVGDHFEWNGFRFEVVDMDGFRVDKLLVNRLEV